MKVRATAGPVLGPPWQRPENGYVFSFGVLVVVLILEWLVIDEKKVMGAAML